MHWSWRQLANSQLYPAIILQLAPFALAFRTRLPWGLLLPTRRDRPDMFLVSHVMAGGTRLRRAMASCFSRARPICLSITETREDNAHEIQPLQDGYWSKLQTTRKSTMQLALSLSSLAGKCVLAANMYLILK